MFRRLFGGKRYWEMVMHIAIPIAIQNLLTSSFVLIDTLMVGQLGDVSLAAVGMAGQWSWLLNLALFGFSSAASVFFSQYYGDGNIKGIKNTYGIVMSFLSIAVVFFTVVGFAMPRTIISIFNRDAAVLDIGMRYLRIAVFSYPAIAFNQIVSVLLRSTGQAKLPMYVSVLTTVLNAFLDYGLIFGHFGMPALGIEGAAIATVISSWIGPLVLAVILLYQKDLIVCAPVKEIFGFSKADVKHFFSRAMPVVVNEILWGLGTFTLNVIYSNLGYEYYAAMTILKTFDNIVFAFFVGLNNSCCIMVGQEIGGGKIRMGIKDAKRFILLVPLLACVASVLIIVFRGGLISIFNTAGTITELTMNTAYVIMAIYAVEFPIRNYIYVVITGVFRSGGDTKTGMRYDLTCLWLFGVLGTFIAAYILKLPFVWVYAVSLVFDDWPKAVLCLRHFFSKKWIMPVTETGREALEEYKKEQKKIS